MIYYVFLGITFSIILKLITDHIFGITNIKFKNFIIPTIIYTIIFVIIKYIPNSTIQFICNIINNFILIKILYKQKISDTWIAIFSVMGTRLLMESFLILLLKILNLNINDYFITTQFVSAYLALILTSYIFKCINYFFKNNIKNNFRFYICFIIFSLIFVCIFGFKIPIKLDYSFIIFYSILLAIILYLIKHSFFLYLHAKDIIDKYSVVSKYSNANENMLNHYRFLIHENKNQLCIIKSMLNDDDSEVAQYINRILNDKGISSELDPWIMKNINYILIVGLKTFIIHKIHKLLDIKANVEFSIDEGISNFNHNILSTAEKNDLYNLLGILFDNAYEALEICDNKQLTFHCYEENNRCHIIIANTYINQLNLSEIYKLGYSSKGKFRGTGLVIVKKIIDSHNIYSINSSIKDNFFVQELIIDANQT